MSSPASSSMSQHYTILFIHGWGSSASLFEKYSKPFREQITSADGLQSTQFLFVNAPMEMEELIGNNPKDQRSWVYLRENRSVYYHWKAGLLSLLNQVKKAKEEGKQVNGILGFSQGGMLSTILGGLISLEMNGLLEKQYLPPSLYEFPHPHDDDSTNFDDIIQGIRENFFTYEGSHKECLIKFIAFVGAFKPNAVQVREMLDVLFHKGLKFSGFKSLVIYGRNDELVVPASTQAIADDWINKEECQVLAFDGRHELPVGEQEKAELIQFIRKAWNQ
ncbi:hypothetical protein C9374_007006 [Naegleria lovaniensis]|uniref:Serine hydrolase domain-containing protein n=1 Tax=Naegleria lovaniensis TaxID=51637 RepID=A0AA88KXV7_NAELO|nr:uncharacterized protein C9374_007006 [Naegleria lovaniensis]KAG2393475.1 hypothetical protein C9374_007006 [Naegleria lovaniensis]